MTGVAEKHGMAYRLWVHFPWAFHSAPSPQAIPVLWILTNRTQWMGPLSPHSGQHWLSSLFHKSCPLFRFFLLEHKATIFPQHSWVLLYHCSYLPGPCPPMWSSYSSQPVFCFLSLYIRLPSLFPAAKFLTVECSKLLSCFCSYLCRPHFGVFPVQLTVKGKGPYGVPSSSSVESRSPMVQGTPASVVAVKPLRYTITARWRQHLEKCLASLKGCPLYELQLFKWERWAVCAIKRGCLSFLFQFQTCTNASNWPGHFVLERCDISQAFLLLSLTLLACS